MNNSIFIIHKDRIHAIILAMCILGVFFLNSKIFLILIVLLCIDKIITSFFSLLLFLSLSPLLIIVDFENFKDYILMFLIIILISSKYIGKERLFLDSYSNILFLLIFSSLFMEQLGGSIWDVLTFEQRLTPIISGDEYGNSNIIGLIGAICFISYFLNRKYFLMGLSLFIVLLTQSRSSILFIFTFLIFSINFSLKKIMLSLVSIIILFFCIYLSPIKDRFINGPGESGDERILRIILHLDTIKNSLPFGFPYQKYLDLSQIYGTIDNNYIYLYIRFGLIGVFSFLLLCLFFILNEKDDFYRVRLALFLSFLLQGLLESSMYGNYFMWPVVAICFNSFINRRSLL